MTDWRQYLQHDPEICQGKLCAKGTRVLVTNILDSLAEGATRKQILENYPSLKPEHIDAAIVYAAELAREFVVKFRFGVETALICGVLPG